MSSIWDGDPQSRGPGGPPPRVAGFSGHYDASFTPRRCLLGGPQLLELSKILEAGVEARRGRARAGQGRSVRIQEQHQRLSRAHRIVSSRSPPVSRGLRLQGEQCYKHRHFRGTNRPVCFLDQQDLLLDFCLWPLLTPSV